MIFREWNNPATPWDEVADDHFWYTNVWSDIFTLAAKSESRRVSENDAFVVATRWINNRRVAAFMQSDTLYASDDNSAYHSYMYVFTHQRRNAMSIWPSV